MRWLRLAVPATLLAAWLAGSFAQQDAPPAGTPPSPPAGTPPAGRQPQPAAPAEEEPEPAPRSDDEEDDDTFVPTEELQPDAAVTFPVDI